MEIKRSVLVAIVVTLPAGCAGLTVSRALAAEAVAYVDEPAPFAARWWYHYYVEGGARAFLNNPQRDGVVALGGNSLAKYYEYSTIKPGPFLEGWASTGSKDGVYQLDAWARNVGYSDQQYQFDASKAGEHYIGVGWDQTPHIYSTSAQTLYNGVGSTNLTLPAGLSNQMFTDAGCTPGPAGCGFFIVPANAAKVQQDIVSNTHLTGIGIRRDTVSVDYRYTPNDRWDFRANYSSTRRTGTQVDGVIFSPSTVGVRVDAPKPVADTTQNYGASGEYAGTSFWDQKFNVKVAYSGSTYTDDSSSYRVENPFCPTGAVNVSCAIAGSPSAPTALMSLWPSNQANGASATAGVDLPLNSRYMGTVAYTNMQQNQPFLPFTLTPFTATGGIPPGWTGTPGIPVTSTAALPAQSLNGNINTLLVNNVITTQITPDLKFKTNYRFYNYDNGTPEIRFADWMVADAVAAKSFFAPLAPVQSISIAYTKQNAGSELNWRPSLEWNVGAAYGYERYDWTRADVNATHENSGKAYVDWKPASWVTARASVSAGQRRYESYDYLAFVGTAQWPAGDSVTRYSTAYRQFMFDNRDRIRAQASLAVDVVRNVTLTPTFSFRDDRYLLNPATEVGLQFDRAVSAGMELAWVVSPDTKLVVSYMNDRQKQLISSAGQGVPPFAPTQYYTAGVVDTVNTYIAAATHAVIPNKLDVTLAYSYVTAKNSQPLVFANGNGPSAATGGQYPDVRSTHQRIEAMAAYTFDEDFVRMMGWNGKVVARLRYAWENNRVENWQTDVMQTYMYSVANFSGYMTWLAWNNPNYNVHRLGASIAFTW
ncbi:MtrB/PioB family decaheme-associated outer membrane protein [Bradyrhizobium sp.]|uniref:MtrB/PioB family decaheme-associated outer membrane protein n=1 Tax=Bradyrhizobium sp. TaxID=376 RepID=UPI003C757456